MLSEIERKAWEKRTDADKHSPTMALRAALDQIERKKIERVHHAVVVLIERDEDGTGDLIHVLQSGDLSEFATEGALGRAIRILQDSD